MSPGVLRELQPPSAWLDSWPLAAAVCALAALLLVALVVRRRRWRLLLAPAVLATVLAAATVANALSAYVPTPQALRFLVTGHVGGSGGVVETVSIGAPALHVPASTTYVYLPPGYRPGAHRYPVAYLLHGSPGRSTDWFAAGDAAHTLDVLIRHHLVPPMLVVAPDTNGGGLRDTECLDDPHGGPQVETYLRSVVVPYVDAHFSTDPRPAARIIGGMSAGGFCALDQGLRHRDTYGPVLAIEPYGDPGAAWARRLTPAQFAAVSPSHYLPTIALPAPVPVFLDIGATAAAADQADTDHVEAELRARGGPVLRRDEAGQGHTWNTARIALPYGLVFAARFLPPA
ncbi:esterase family protein [Kineosporiaceae bacterium B12]|nr:esterase family protein [Kineococcus rubinsiae]